MEPGRSARSAWLASASRSTAAFTPPYKPAPLTFMGQLWAALSRSTPAFTGARAPIGIRSAQQRRAAVLDLAKTEIVNPTFLNRDRADTFTRDRGRILALTLARDRELGLKLACEFARNCADFLAGIFGTDNPYSFSELSTSTGDDSEEFYEFCHRVQKTHTLAVTLERVLTRDLNRASASVRSNKRRRSLAEARKRTRARLRPNITDKGVDISPLSSWVMGQLIIVADTFYRSQPATVASRRARDISLELAASFDRLHISYIQASELSRGLHQDLAATDLRGTELPNAQFALASMRGSNLYDAHLSGANLSGVDLIDAHLIGADLSCADLSGAHLNHADLRNANLKGADLSRADMSGADPHGVVWSKATSWPAAFEREMWARSREIAPGVFQVDEGGERSPLKELHPVRY